MKRIHRPRDLFWQTWARVGAGRDERGDVPGWVMVTVMTAGMVMVIWGVAEGQLRSMLSAALSQVK